MSNLANDFLVGYTVNESFSAKETRTLLQLIKSMYKILPESYRHEITNELLPLTQSFKVDISLETGEVKLEAKLKDLFNFDLGIETIQVENSDYVVKLFEKGDYGFNLSYQQASFLVRNLILLAKYVSPNKIEINNMENPLSNKVFCALVVRDFLKELEEKEVEHSFLQYS